MNGYPIDEISLTKRVMAYVVIDKGGNESNYNKRFEKDKRVSGWVGIERVF